MLDLVKKSLILFIAYWLLMLLVGYELSFYTLKFVNNLDERFLIVARDYLAVGLILFLLGSCWIFLIKSKNGFINTRYIGFTLMPFLLVLCVCSVMFYLTYSAVGYVPLFHHVPGAKYFQDVTEIYVHYRPFYTLAINLSVAAIMALLIIYFYADSAKKKTRILLLLFLFVIMLALTGKRGAILLPFAYLLVGMYLIGRVKIVRLSIFFAFLVLIAGGLHLIFNSNDNLFVGMMDSISNSFFVGVRELARFLTNFEGENIYGLSYWASLTSFIPTSLNEIKDLYLYPRYLILLEGGNPDLSGGPRGTYIGETLANFGLIGFVITSWLFGVLFYFMFKMFLSVRYFRSNKLAFGFVGAFILHQLVLAFFENGSSFLFHFMSKFMFLYVLLYISNRSARSVSEI